MATDRGTIKSYNKYAATWAERIRSGNNISHEYLEKPGIRSMLPPIKGKVVLCLGCGTGEECDHLMKLGAKRVIGIDVSRGLIEYAKSNYPHVEFHMMDMEKLKFKPNTFDFVYSSLAIHYVKEWSCTLREVKRVLKPGGVFLFSTHHPVKWGAACNRTKDKKSFIMGYTKFNTKDQCEISGDYLTTRKITDTWFDDFTVSFYHKPFESILKDIIQSGFVIADFKEPKAIPAAKKRDPAFWNIHQKIPIFMIFKLVKSK